MKKTKMITKSMEISINKEFRDAYLSLPRANDINKKIKAEIMEKCKVTKAIFYNWTRSTTLISKRDRKIISEIMNIPESKLFPQYEKKQTAEFLKQRKKRKALKMIEKEKTDIF